MLLQYNGFTKKIATANDLKDKWENNKLPDIIEKEFYVEDSYIRHLHSSNYSLFKDSLTVDHFVQGNNDNNIIIQLNKQKLGVWLVTVYYDIEQYDYHDFLCNENDLIEALGDY